MADTQQRIYHAVHMGVSERKKRICPICKQTFYATQEHWWKAHARSTSTKDFVCSYSCMRAVERREADEREKRLAEQEDARRRKREEMRAKESAGICVKYRHTPSSVLHERLVECTRRLNELMAFREKPAYKRLTERDRRSIGRKIRYYYKRCEELNKQLEGRKQR